MTARLHHLSNGVRVVCDAMPGLESAALSVVAGAGSRFEPEDRHGWSHLLEHMVFKGAGDRSARDIVEVIEAEGGWVNAATGYERTSFQVRCLAGGLPLALEVLTDLVRRPILDAGELEREKGVVAQEIAEAADTPDDLVFELAQARAFPNQPIGRAILGTEASLAPATPDSLRAWKDALYGDPARLVISAAGAVDEDALLRHAEAAFGDLRPPTHTLSLPQAALFESGAVAQSRKLEQAHLVFLAPGVGAHHPHWAAQRLFTEVLGGGMASRLFQEAREKRGLAYAVDAFAELYADAGVLGIYAGAAPKDAGPLAELVAQELLKLAEAVEPAELARAKAQARSGLFMGRESPLARAEQNAGHALLFDRMLPVAELADALAGVDAEAFAAYGASVVQSGKAAGAVLGPKTAGAAAETFGRALGRG